MTTMYLIACAIFMFLLVRERMKNERLRETLVRAFETPRVESSRYAGDYLFQLLELLLEGPASLHDQCLDTKAESRYSAIAGALTHYDELSRQLLRPSLFANAAASRLDNLMTKIILSDSLDDAARVYLMRILRRADEALISIDEIPVDAEGTLCGQVAIHDLLEYMRTVNRTLEVGEYIASQSDS